VLLFDTTLVEGVDYYGYVKNLGSECVYIGCSNVTEACGYELDEREELEIKFMNSDDAIKAVCKSEETSNVCWFLTSYT
jgi:hypothetical protein